MDNFIAWYNTGDNKVLFNILWPIVTAIIMLLLSTWINYKVSRYAAKQNQKDTLESRAKDLSSKYNFAQMRVLAHMRHPPKDLRFQSKYQISLGEEPDVRLFPQTYSDAARELERIGALFNATTAGLVMTGGAHVYRLSPTAIEDAEFIWKHPEFFPEVYGPD